MDDRARQPDFVGESLQPIVPTGDRFGHELEGDSLAEAQIVCAIYLSHRAASQQADDAVA